MTTAIERRITRFGIELEMLPQQDEERDCDCCGGSGEVETEIENVDDETGRVSYDYVTDSCDECYGDGRVGSDDSDMADAALDVFRRAGLTDHLDQHEYHCDCDECDYRRDSDSGIFSAQKDCTVGIEFVSRIMSTGDQHVFDLLDEALPTVWEQTRWEPDGYANCGNHIHIGFTGEDGGRRFLWETVVAADETTRALIGMFPRGFEHLASAGLGHMRGYNRHPEKARKGYEGKLVGNDSLLRLRDHGTLEFRLWNTPKDPERIAFHVNASLAMTRWAFGRYAGKGPDRRQVLLEAVREDALSADEAASGVIAMLDTSFKNHVQHREWLTAALAS